jgi:hypothetical protein
MNPFRFKPLTALLGALSTAPLLFAGVVNAQSSSATLTIDGCSSLTYSGGTTFTCVPVSTPSGAPTGCSVTPAATSLPATGGQVSLTGACTGGGAITSTTWKKNGVAFTPGFPDTLADNSASSSAAVYTYVATFCAGTACTSASATATVAAGTAPPPPPPVASCGSLKVIEPYQDGNPAQKVLTFTGDRFLTSGFASNTTTVVVAQIDVPAGLYGATTLAVFEYGSSATSRKAWLSKTRCDMSATSPPYRQTAMGPVFNIQIGGSASDKVVMQPGETWYLMVKNEKLLSTGSSCATGTCDIGIKLYRP